VQPKQPDEDGAGLESCECCAKRWTDPGCGSGRDSATDAGGCTILRGPCPFKGLSPMTREATATSHVLTAIEATSEGLLELG
jgi:hypothetical protein